MIARVRYSTAEVDRRAIPASRPVKTAVLKECPEGKDVVRAGEPRRVSVEGRVRPKISLSPTVSRLEPTIVRVRTRACRWCSRMKRRIVQIAVRIVSPMVEPSAVNTCMTMVRAGWRPSATQVVTPWSWGANPVSVLVVIASQEKIDSVVTAVTASVPARLVRQVSGR